MTKAQEWARKRNGAKWRIKGINENLRNLSMESSLLTTERAELRRAVLFITQSLNNWEERNSLSKKKFMEGVTK